jgi:hypothetical protein
MRGIKSGEVKFASITMTDTRVQDYGNVGVVTGSLAEKAQYKNSDTSGTYRFTDILAKRNGKWEHVAGQETLVSTPAEAPASAASDVADVKTALATLINLQLQYDAAGVNKLLDPQFVYVSNDGSVMSRAEFIDLTDREKNPLDSLEVKDVQVRAWEIRHSQRVSFTYLGARNMSFGVCVRKTASQAPESAHREDEGEHGSHAEGVKRPDEQEGSAALRDLTAKDASRSHHVDDRHRQPQQGPREHDDVPRAPVREQQRSV